MCSPAPPPKTATSATSATPAAGTATTPATTLPAPAGSLGSAAGAASGMATPGSAPTGGGGIGGSVASGVGATPPDPWAPYAGLSPQMAIAYANQHGAPAGGFNWDSWMAANPGAPDPRTHTAGGDAIDLSVWGGANPWTTNYSTPSTPASTPIATPTPPPTAPPTPPATPGPALGAGGMPSSGGTTAAPTPTGADLPLGSGGMVSAGGGTAAPGTTIPDVTQKLPGAAELARQDARRNPYGNAQPVNPWVNYAPLWPDSVPQNVIARALMGRKG